MKSHRSEVYFSTESEQRRKFKQNKTDKKLSELCEPDKQFQTSSPVKFKTLPRI